MTTSTPDCPLAPSVKHPTNSVTAVLSERIQSGQYKTGDCLPTERRLAEELGVDRRAARAAIDQLVRGGFVFRRPRCRPIVMPPNTEPAPAPEPKSSRVSPSFIALLMWRGGDALPRGGAQQRIFWGMNRALADAGHHAVLVDLGVSGSEEENAAREAEQLRRLRKRGFGGAIFCSNTECGNRALVEELAASIPFVTIDRGADDADAYSDEEIGQKAAEMLLRRLEAPHIPSSSGSLHAELLVRASSAAP